MTKRKSIKAQNETISGLEDKVHKCAKYLFCRGGNKQSIMRAEIAKHLTDKCQVSKEHVEIILNKAQSELKRVYGYNLVELKETNAKQYIIVLDHPSYESLSSFTNPFHRRQLLAALTHIFMTGAPVDEVEMWKFLAEARVLPEDDFNGRKIFTHTFPKQCYLTLLRSKVGEEGATKNVFDWGPRAHEELPKMYLLEKVAEALEKEPTYWSEQYKIAAGNSNESRL